MRAIFSFLDKSNFLDRAIPSIQGEDNVNCNVLDSHPAEISYQSVRSMIPNLVICDACFSVHIPVFFIYWNVKFENFSKIAKRKAHISAKNWKIHPQISLKQYFLTKKKKKNCKMALTFLHCCVWTIQQIATPKKFDKWMLTCCTSLLKIQYC